MACWLADKIYNLLDYNPQCEVIGDFLGILRQLTLRIARYWCSGVERLIGQWRTCILRVIVYDTRLVRRTFHYF